MLADLQSAFHTGILTGDSNAARRYVRAGDPDAAARRFQIYRTNAVSSLIGVIAAAYPTIRRLVGAGFFQAAAKRFVENHPPARPQLMLYGDGFPHYLAQLQEAAALPYLADIAAIEWARNRAYFAADADPLDPAALAGVPPEETGTLRFVLHPASTLVRSEHPIAKIWHASQEESATHASVDASGGGEAVLIFRAHNHVTEVALDASDALFVEALSMDENLEQALTRAVGEDPRFELQTTLAAHFSRGTFSGFIRPARQETG